jgi:hypothetical protein
MLEYGRAGQETKKRKNSRIYPAREKARAKHAAQNANANREG